MTTATSQQNGRINILVAFLIAAIQRRMLMDHVAHRERTALHPQGMIGQPQKLLKDIEICARHSRSRAEPSCIRFVSGVKLTFSRGVMQLAIVGGSQETFCRTGTELLQS